MKTKFDDRTEAGKCLAERLSAYAGRKDVVVLGLSRGGVPVAAQVAARLKVPLDVFVVRKLGVPGQSELAMGAIASGGVRVVNWQVKNLLEIPDSVLNAVALRQMVELERREHVYRGNRPPLDVKAKTVIVVDDGLATGSTMKAAVQALRKLGVGRVIVAAPTMAPSAWKDMQEAADEVVAVLVPDDFYAVAQWYRNFKQTTDAEVRRLLAAEHFPPLTPAHR
jgi:predicted phosphoribosyltransferase